MCACTLETEYLKHACRLHPRIVLFSSLSDSLNHPKYSPCINFGIVGLLFNSVIVLWPIICHITLHVRRIENSDIDLTINS